MAEEMIHHKRYLENLEILKKLRLLDDDFMKVVLRDKKAIEKILQIIMENPNLQVDDVHSEDDLHSLVGHSVRLDVHAKDKEGNHYDVEIQRASKGAGKKRARFNLGLLDSSLLDRSVNYNELPETYVIFITELDFLKGSLPVYHVERVIQETGELFGDGEHIIYVNGAYKGDDAFGVLMSDFRASDPEDIQIQELKEPIEYYKNKEGRTEMCKIIEDMRIEERAEGLAEGRAEGRAEIIRTLLETMTPEKVAQALRTSIEEVLAAKQD